MSFSIVMAWDNMMIERFSFEFRKVIGFALSRLAIGKEVRPKLIATRWHTFSRALVVVKF